MSALSRFCRRIRFVEHGSVVFKSLIALIICLAPLQTEAADTALEREIHNYLKSSLSLIDTAIDKCQAGKQCGTEISQIKKIGDPLKTSFLLLKEGFKEREISIAALGQTALKRHRGMADGYRRSLNEYFALIDSLSPQADRSVNLSTLKNLRSSLGKVLHKKQRPILGSLPYRNLNYAVKDPSAATPIVPAYRGGNKIVVPDDLQGSPEAPVDKEIATLAQTLNWSPIEIYEHVKNNIETEWYWGNMKGAVETLHQKSGNDADQAALLVALLRASGYPARYVRGTIEFFPGIEKVKNLTGIDDPAKIAVFFQTSGIPFKPVISGGRIINFQIEHIWVESQIPYSNYRGAIIDEHGKTWLGLDTSIKVNDYQYSDKYDLARSMSMAGLRDEFISTNDFLEPAEFIKTKIQNHLSSRPELFYSDLLRKRILPAEAMNILPASLQFDQKRITHEYTTLPDELKHKIKLTAHDKNNAELLTIILNVQDVSNRKVELSYEPDTIEDQQIINSYGGLDNTPSYLVKLRPVIKVNDERMIVARDGLPMGEDFHLKIDLISPNGTESSTSTHIAGNLSILGIVAQKTVALETVAPEDKNAAQLLYEEAINYINRWNQAEDELAALLYLNTVRPTPTVVVTGGVIDVTYLLDQPHGYAWKGVYLDARLRTINVQPASAGVDDRQRTFMQLAALQGSVLENKIFEDNFKVDAVSTAKLMQIANQQAISLVTINKDNIAAILPTLLLDENIKEDIANAVNQNNTVKLPGQAITYQDWMGVGYIKENPETGEAGYMLSGMVAGGMTAWGIDKWSEYYANILSNPFSEPPVYSPAGDVYIQKITSGDLQKGTVGQPLPRPLQVYVYTINKKTNKKSAVPDKEIIFTVKKGGGTFANGGTTITVKTGKDKAGKAGIAEVHLILGKKTADNPTCFYKTGDKYSQQVGENIVDAALASGLSIEKPFTAYGMPDVPANLKKTNGDERTDTILTYAGFLSVIVEDQYGNPISNIPVTFTVLPAADQSTCSNPNKDTRQAVLIKEDDACVYNSPTLGQCSTQDATHIIISATHGSSIGVIMGGIPKGKYPFTANASGLNATFNLYTWPFGACAASSDPSAELNLTYVYPADEYGNNINAGKVGCKIPIQARMYFLKEGETDYTDTYKCSQDAPPFPCTKKAGARTYDITTAFSSSSVTFGGQGSVNAGNGVFKADYILGPGLNKITISGNAVIQENRTEICPACETSIHAISQNRSAVMEFYGVDIKIDPIPVVLVNEAGYSRNDCKITYAISPADYKASTVYVFIYKDGEVIAAMPAELQGGGFGTITKGFTFNPSAKYEAEVVLNYGSAVEIRSEKKQLVVFEDDGTGIGLERSYHHSIYDSFIPAPPAYTDGYQILKFKLPEAATVSVAIMDSDGVERATAVAATSLSPGDYSFVVDYDMIHSAGIVPSASMLFYLRLVVQPGNGSDKYEILYPGRLRERHDGNKMPGQLIVHDVMIQDGSLHLTRKDLLLKGRGPQFDFTRSYHSLNQSFSTEFMPFGPGWNHNFDLKIRPLITTLVQTGPVPDLVADMKGKVFPAGSVQIPQDGILLAQVNGTTFKKVSGVWYAERGQHGTLDETVSSFIFTSKDGTRYTYGYPSAKPMPVQTIQDRNGNTMTFTYETYLQGDRLISVKDATGRIFTFTYEPVLSSSRLVKINGPDGIELLFSYNAYGNLYSAQSADRVETYAYEAEQGVFGGAYNLTVTTDSNDNSFSYQYHALSELTNYQSIQGLKPQDVIKTVAYPDAKKAKFQYDFTNNKRTITDLNENDTVYVLNSYGNPLRIEEPLGKLTRMTWSIDEGKNDNVMTSRTNARNYTTTYQYDAKGNITRETDSTGKSIITTWNQKFSLPEARTDRNGVIRSWQYDTNNGNLLKQTDGDNKITQFGYYATGEMRSRIDPRGYETTYDYDSYGNPVKVTGPEGSVTVYQYDERGRKQAQTDPNGNQTHYTYNALDYPTMTKHPDVTQGSLAAGYKNIQLFNYDPEGNMLSETNRNGLTLTYTYTKRNQVSTVSRSTGRGKAYSYDGAGNLLSETDWKGQTTRHAYNALNQRIQTINRLGYCMAMSYDLEGNLTSATDYEGRVTDYAYDHLNRQTDIWQPAMDGQGRGHIVNTYYAEADPKTNLKTVTDQETNATSFEYNGRYLRTKRTNALSHTYLTEYDDSGNVSKETDEENNFTTYVYDKQNRRTSATRMGGIVTGYAYDLNGNQTRITDPRGNATVTDYDAWNRAYRVTDPDSHTTVLVFDGEGNKVQARDGNGNLRTWQRDAQGRVVTAANAEGYATQYEYDANDNVTSMIEANGMVTTTGYDAEDRAATVKESAAGSGSRGKAIVARDKMGNPLQAKDYNGYVTTTAYNGLNLPQSICDPKGKCAYTDYFKTGKVKSAKNKRGFMTSYLYDSLNRETKITDAKSQTIETTYDKVGNIKTVKDKRGIVKENTYDPLYRLTQVVKDGIRLVTNEYDGNNNLTATIDANNNRVEHQYNKRNLRAVTTYISDGTSETRIYDGVGNLMAHVNEESQTTTYTYDKENRQTSVTFAGEKTQKAYDGVGNLISTTRPKGNIRQMTYDGWKRLTAVIDDPQSLKLTTGYQYDPNNNLLAQYDAHGNRTTFFYDELNRKIQQSQFVYITRYGYDEEGNLTSMKDANGQTTSHTYDELSRLSASIYHEQTIANGYDPNNNLTSVTENKTQAGITDLTVNTYDNFDRLSSSNQRNLAVNYAYDNNGNRSSVATAAAATTYTYDGKNRIKTTATNNQTATYTYTPAGKKDTVTYPNITSVKYAYFDNNRIKTIENKAGATTISSYAYVYDQNGNRTKQTEYLSGTTETTNYSYDGIDRLLDWTISNKTRTVYTYGGYNRKTETVYNFNPETLVKQQTYDYDETDRLTRISDNVSGKTINYTYDNNGNTIRKVDLNQPSQEVNFTYDSRNQLTQTKRGPPGSEIILGQYDYNYAGLRVRHKNSDRGDIDYFCDGKSVIEERTATGNTLIAHYNYADRLLSLRTPAGTQYYHHDALGSTVNLTDAAGNTQVSYQLDPWGYIRSQYGTSVNRQIFTGQEHDPNTGLIYFGARYYDPDTARFITQDPYLGEPNTPPSLNRYLYAYSNPTIYVDLEGYASELPPLSEESKVGYFNQGYVYTQYRTAQKEFENPSNAIFDRALYFVGGTMTLPLAWAEEYGVRPLLNAPNTVLNSGVKIGEHSARIVTRIQDKDYGGAVEEGLYLTQKSSEGFLAGVSVALPLANNLRFNPKSSKISVIKESRSGAANTENTLVQNERAERRIIGGDRSAIDSNGNEIQIVTDFIGDKRTIGKSPFSDLFYSIPNKSGGRVYVSVDEIDQTHFEGLVNLSNSKKNIKILTGTHGDLNGNRIKETAFYREDWRKWGAKDGIDVIDINKLSAKGIDDVVNVDARVICAWCFSERSNDVLRALGLKN